MIKNEKKWDVFFFNWDGGVPKRSKTHYLRLVTEGLQLSLGIGLIHLHLTRNFLKFHQRDSLKHKYALLDQQVT